MQKGLEERGYQKKLYETRLRRSKSKSATFIKKSRNPALLQKTMIAPSQYFSGQKCCDWKGNQVCMRCGSSSIAKLRHILAAQIVTGCIGMYWIGDQIKLLFPGYDSGVKGKLTLDKVRYIRMNDNQGATVGPNFLSADLSIQRLEVKQDDKEMIFFVSIRTGRRYHSCNAYAASHSNLKVP